MNIFNQMAKHLAESANGKIVVYPNGYEFSDKGTTNSSGVYLKPTESASGQLISLSLGVRTASNCPLPPGKFPQNKKRPGLFWVPMKDCRKCPHHLKRRRGQPYPCCAVIRRLKASGPSPAEKMQEMLAGAVEKAKEIIG